MFNAQPRINPWRIKNNATFLLQDGSKIFTASCDKTAMVWDLGSNQMTQIAAHDAPIKTIHHIKASNYTCVMTGSWDKTLKVGSLVSWVFHPFAFITGVCHVHAFGLWSV